MTTPSPPPHTHPKIKSLLYSRTEIYLHCSLLFPCTRGTDIRADKQAVAVCNFKCYFRTVDIIKILWLRVPGYPCVPGARVLWYKISTRPSQGPKRGGQNAERIEERTKRKTRLNMSHITRKNVFRDFRPGQIQTPA